MQHTSSAEPSVALNRSSPSPTVVSFVPRTNADSVFVRAQPFPQAGGAEPQAGSETGG